MKKPTDEVVRAGRRVMIIASRPEQQWDLIKWAEKVSQLSGQELHCFGSGALFSVFSQGNIAAIQMVIDDLWPEVESLTKSVRITETIH